MDTLLKHAIDGNAVEFISRFKDKMEQPYADARAEITQRVAAEIAGTEVQEKEKMHVVADFSSGNLMWWTSTDRTGSDPKQKNDKTLKSYFKKVLGTSDFTLEILK